MDDTKFLEWVKKWNIGPGMNDKPGTANYSGWDGIVGEGWLPILDRLAADLKEMGWDGSLSQVKEKFGTLRFYANFSAKDEVWKKFHERIGKAEEESAVTCEDCGEPGTQTKTRWIRTLCDKCVKKTR